MEIMQGYKSAELILIPGDWEVRKLGDLVRNVEYGSCLKSKTDGRVPVIRMGNIQNGKLDFSSLVYTDNEIEIKRYHLRYNDVLFNRTNTVDLVGKTGIYKNEMPAIFAGYLIRINIRQDDLDADYLNYWLNTRKAKNYGNSVLSMAVGQANINGAKLKTYPIPIPPTKNEQIAISEALNDITSLISAIEKLINKKRNIKRGTMQQLLTGKVRLTDFERLKGYKQTEFGAIPRDWELKELGGICNPTKNRINPLLEKNSYKCIELEHISQETGRILGFANSIDLRSQKSLFHHGDVLFGKLRPYLRKYYYADFDGICSTEIWVLKSTKDIDSLWLYYIIQSNKVIEVANQSIGTKMPRAEWQSVRNTKIPLPSTLFEQKAIAKILSNIDAELNSLESQLEKYKLIKQGMMQNLLTGKIRLI